MAKLGFIGLGQMGMPMATRLLAAGDDLTVWNRTPEKANTLADMGASVARTPADAATDTEAAITMLANPDALEQVLFGAAGLAAALGPGQLLIDMSTVGPDEVRSAAARLPDGVRMVDAPVRGSVPEATHGTLDIYVGADDEVFERVRVLLGPLGNVHHVGGFGAGAATKVVVNSTLAATIEALGEALALGGALGLDRDTLLDVLADSSLAPTVAGKRANIEAGSYPPSFKLRLALKDIALVTDAADRAGRDLKLARAARAWLSEADRAGAGDLDYSAVVETIIGTRATH
jgi:3-hydroxyisobutyrate dehydrogenase-like beta-hydroxyacid dehydrogenase